MKLSLVVLTPGKTQGQAIAIKLSQFLIGRDPHCHLRPASPTISNRHCAVLVREDKVFVRDFESTNGTFVNGEKVKGEKEIHDEDRLRLGPLEFTVRLEVEAPLNRPTPVPQARPPADPVDDEAAAALLLSLQEGEGLPPAVDSEGIPTGSTVMEMPAVPPTEEGDKKEEAKPEKDKSTAGKAGAGDTALAANSLLQKYLRRPRKAP
jgi:pSer/pThr/pTyr-binding forkhead associated (FHA) protein